MKKQIWIFTLSLTVLLQVFNLFNYAFHDYAHLEIDMLDAKYIHEPVKNQEEALIVHFIEEFKKEAESQGLYLDYSRLTYKIHDRLGHNQAFIRRDISTLATCQQERQHMTFLRSEINPYNLLQFRATVFHELGHCVLGLDHEEDYDTMGNPNILVTVDIVNWNLMPNYYWDVAVNNLLNRAKNQ